MRFCAVGRDQTREVLAFRAQEFTIKTAPLPAQNPRMLELHCVGDNSQL
jgi:hypothetical protein